MGGRKWIYTRYWVRFLYISIMLYVLSSFPNNLLNFFSTEKLLEPPKTNDIANAIIRLQDVGAFNSEHVLTPLGHHLAKLPVNVRIGKLIIFGTIFCCLDSALTIAACLSHKSPFSIPPELRKKINPKKEFFVANSDQLTTLKAYKVKYPRNDSRRLS